MAFPAPGGRGPSGRAECHRPGLRVESAEPHDGTAARARLLRQSPIFLLKRPVVEHTRPGQPEHGANLSPLKPSPRFPGTISPAVAGAVLVAGLGLFFGFSPSGRGLAHASYDFAYLFRPPTRVDGAVLVLMDDGSFDDPQLHQDRAREWDRNLRGELISRLVARGARAVAFDVLFAAAGTNDGPFLEAVRAATHAHVPVVVAATLHSGSGGGVAKPFPALAREAAWGFAEQEVE